MKTSYSIIGAMAGSSMDGLDLAQVTFSLRKGFWDYEIEKCETIPYSKVIFAELKKSPLLEESEKKKIDSSFGKWIGEKIEGFVLDTPAVDLLAVHGHTSLHDPENGISEQLGNGEVIASACGIPTITEFRSRDVKLGGQGAPLVPVGDFDLFKEFDACLNLGGIANVSMKFNKTAWDICPCNQVLNHFSEKLGLPYDHEGRIAEKSSLDKLFYSEVANLDFFKQSPPKSLPNNYVSSEVLEKINPKTGLHTYVAIVSDLISQALNLFPKKSKLLITGGGAFNTYLVEEISKRLIQWEVVIPDAKLISFKESLVFAFLGLKRFRNEINVLASVTGASKDTCSGVIHLPK
ncbi:anhydro-N-acetylmuramic acid kinase [Ekhidna sp.]